MNNLNNGWDMGYGWIVGIILLLLISAVVAIVLSQKKNYKRLNRNSTRNMFKGRYEFLSKTY
ncbi:MAG: hypothetical protein WC699_14950 [Bacteroidales bacterium]|jgi:hypothetical protein